LLLQQAQELGLRQGRHVANFVEKERATRTLFELADAFAIGPCECAFLVPEQLALEQIVGDAAQLIARKGARLRRLC